MCSFYYTFCISTLCFIIYSSVLNHSRSFIYCVSPHFTVGTGISEVGNYWLKHSFHLAITSHFSTDILHSSFLMYYSDYLPSCVWLYLSVISFLLFINKLELIKVIKRASCSSQNCGTGDNWQKSGSLFKPISQSQRQELCSHNHWWCPHRYSTAPSYPSWHDDAWQQAALFHPHGNSYH